MRLFNRFKKDSLIKRAYKLFNHGKYEEALDYYNQILEIDPNYSQAWNGKGAALNELGHSDRALKCSDFGFRLFKI